MKEGFRGNYETGVWFQIHEHERWLRGGNNAERLGVPKDVIAEFLVHDIVHTPEDVFVKPDAVEVKTLDPAVPDQPIPALHIVIVTAG